MIRIQENNDLVCNKPENIKVAYNNYDNSDKNRRK